MEMKKLIAFFIALALCGFIRADETFKVRAMHIDLRSQVMSTEALHGLVDMASSQGLNSIIMEWESNFPFEQNAVLRGPHSYSRDEFNEFISYATRKGIDIIPLQNCFGHCEYILRHERYMKLRETWNKYDQVCPRKLSIATPVFESIFKEIAELHPSKYIHIGADETRQLGVCPKCQKYLEKHTKSDLFCEYIVAMCNIVRNLGKTPVIWGDILMKYPEAVDKLPKDLVVMDWNYGWDIKHFGDIKRIQAAGLEVWGAPSLRCYPDNYFLVQWGTHFRNLDTYIPYCRENGFQGIVNTSWSTSGQFGVVFELDAEVISMIPEREVYPLVAFRILQEAYATAVKSPEFRSSEFTRKYLEDNFGFEGKDLDDLCAFFRADQKNVYGKFFTPKDIQTELAIALANKELFHNLKPRDGKEEFAHFVLMSDIRVNYLRYMLINCYHESPDFDISKAPEYVEELTFLIKEEKVLAKRFIKLNKNYLKDASAYYGNWSYCAKMKELCKILDNID